MNNITSATTKSEIMEAVKKFLPKLRKLTTKPAKELADSISYANNMYKKDPAKVTKKDLLSMFNLAEKMLATPVSATGEKATPTKADAKKPTLTKSGQKVAEKKTENLTKKPAASKSTKVAESKSEEPKKAPAKGKPAPKSSEKKTEEKVEEKKMIFPTSFTTETEDGEVTYEKCSDIKSMDELCKLLSDEDNNYIVAWYYPKNAIKQNYPRTLEKSKSLKSFENDLDLTIPVYVSDDGDIVYCVSLYTEAYYDIFPSEVTEGDKFAGGIPYQIYKEI